MKRFLLALFFVAPLNAGLITVVCQAGATYITQSDPASAQCAALATGPPNQADANGTIVAGSISGFTDVSSDNDSAFASVNVSFDYVFASTTTVTWIVDPTVSGPFGYVQLDLAGLMESYCQIGVGPCTQGPLEFTQTLGPGDYTFSAYAQVSDEGSSAFTVTSSIIPAPTPEPGTMALVASVLLAGLGYWRKMRGARS